MAASARPTEGGRSLYGARFFDSIRPGAERSAAATVPTVLRDVCAPATVIDVGGGEGCWAQEFRRHGCEAVVVDGHEAADITADLAQPLRVDGRFHLAVCLEVAEHLPPERAEGFVADLCALAPTVLFSAAIPGQHGTGHVNEQWPAYWRDLFAQHGYAGSGALRWRLWEDDAIEWWYRQNLLVFGAHDLPQDGCPSVVHPAAWRWHGHA